ncbi:fructose-1-phosphate kinase [Parageobacillus thermantarcticus]|uniref:Tagatose-6-phosphate kinase n=1 Tax=Parageobacillus thermantarcticus TaxID=186116 RepID=A0A1I0SLS2_9BACL|nr:1-phosphofructokinase [Parageobacillus thermantarcticus]SFA40475.1 fructose-1-phosphate kinase [Parageobacillus thermantarcticus]
MIYTCTLNPSVDYIVHVDELRLGELNRAVKTLTFPGGKGINVSRVLKRLGVESTALGFIGGFTGSFIIEQLQNENIACDFVEVPGNTRINVKLKSGTETEINGQGPMMEPEHEEALIKKLQALTENDVVVLAGSVPSSLSPDVYEKIIDEAKKAKAKVVVDTSGPVLKQLLARKPFLAKPNHKELAELFETSFHSQDEIMVYGRRLAELGVENVIVSMAGNGAFYFNKEITLFAEAPKGTVKNSVGAGDSMVAGFLAAYTSGKSLEEAFAYSVASGSATAFSEDLCTKDYVEQLIREVNVICF